VPATNIDPREVHVLAVEAADVEREVRDLTAQVKEALGRVVKGPTTALERSGQVTSHVVFDVPLAMAATIVDKVKATGTVRVSQLTPNPQAPEGKLAIARINVTLANADVLVPRDAGLWTQVRSGLSISFRGLFASLTWLIVGLLFVLPWLLVIFAIIWVARRLASRPPVLATVTPAGDVAGAAQGGLSPPQ
jgi:hypothetical protein